MVITIIGILAALITAAAPRRSTSARQAQIETEITRSRGFAELQRHRSVVSTECSNGRHQFAIESPASPNPLNEAQAVQDVKRHLKQAFRNAPRAGILIAALAGTRPGSHRKRPTSLRAGCQPAKRWCSGSAASANDEKYPISGEGGPSYPSSTPAAA